MSDFLHDMQIAKVDMPYSTTTVNLKSMFEWNVDLKSDTKNTCVQNRLACVLKNMLNDSILNGQHD